METLEVLRAEFEGIVHDNSVLKNQREEFEAKGTYFFCLDIRQHTLNHARALIMLLHADIGIQHKFKPHHKFKRHCPSISISITT
jgi:hypothetical protein